MEFHLVYMGKGKSHTQQLVFLNVSCFQSLAGLWSDCHRVSMDACAFEIFEGTSKIYKSAPKIFESASKISEVSPKFLEVRQFVSE